MSRKIDRSDLSKLSKADLLYLRERGQLTPAQEEQFLGGINPSPPKAAPLSETPNLGDVGTASSDYEEEDGDTEAETYDDLTKKQLQKLASSRGLPTSGSKDDLIIRLEEQDEENAAEGEEDSGEEDEEEGGEE